MIGSSLPRESVQLMEALSARFFFGTAILLVIRAFLPGTYFPFLHIFTRFIDSCRSMNYFPSDRFANPPSPTHRRSLYDAYIPVLLTHAYLNPNGTRSPKYLLGRTVSVLKWS